MCGIVGYLENQHAVPIVMECLKRVEYGGYDSAVIGVLQHGRLEVRRSVGKITRLERILRKAPIKEFLGIVNTRWATHGNPSDGNAHSHRDHTRALHRNCDVDQPRNLAKSVTVK